MKKYHILLALLATVLISCTDKEDYQTPDFDKQSDHNLITIEDIDDHGITYSVMSNNKVNELINKKVIHKGEEYLILSKFTSTHPERREFIENNQTQIIVVSESPAYGDILVHSQVIEFTGGTLNSNGSYTCIYPGCEIVGSKVRQAIGAPTSSLLATIDYQGESKSNIYYCSATIDRYIGSSTTYEPEMWESVARKYTASTPGSSPNCPSFADPIGKSKSTWANGYKYVSVFVGCDD
ncbi:hypothetical protein C9994_06675 [Marivirga lumbricoides]|uniref:Lipoprotein n=1 Tax=Marivirga lumbricoides TaxID=1046115 RepID=A0A2T4DRX8_9BACT|nr:hypothetical protein C9994_06675 [Marivirga lumbricoides]